MTSSTDTEAEALRRRFDALPREMTKIKFARSFGVPGGASMVSQHLSGNRPISLDAAMAYARGFSVSLSDISQRLTDQVLAAFELLGDAESRPSPRKSIWPFRRLGADQWAALDDYDRALVEDAALAKLRAIMAERGLGECPTELRQRITDQNMAA